MSSSGSKLLGGSARAGDGLCKTNLTLDAAKIEFEIAAANGLSLGDIQDLAKKAGFDPECTHIMQTGSSSSLETSITLSAVASGEAVRDLTGSIIKLGKQVGYRLHYISIGNP